MSELEHDKEFEAYLARRSGSRSRLAEHDDLEPPRDLDRIVLAKARQAIEMPRQLPFYAGARWALPVALAATLVLSFAVILHFGRVPGGVRNVTAPLNAQMDSQAPAMVAEEARERSQSTPAQNERREKAEAPIPTTDLAAARSAPVPAPAAVAPKDSVVTTGARKPDAYSAAVSEAAIKRAAAAAPDPAAWLRRIEQLRARGKTDEAERELRNFRKAWPDYPLPPAPDR